MDCAGSKTEASNTVTKFISKVDLGGHGCYGLHLGSRDPAKVPKTMNLNFV